MNRFALRRKLETFHTPGGVEHDQSSHAGEGATIVTDSDVADWEASSVVGDSKHGFANKLLGTVKNSEVSGIRDEKGRLLGYYKLGEPTKARTGKYKAPGRYIEIDEVVVAPHAQGQGLSARLASRAIAEAKSKGAKYVCAEAASPHGARLLRKSGFTSLGNGQWYLKLG